MNRTTPLTDSGACEASGQVANGRHSAAMEPRTDTGLGIGSIRLRREIPIRRPLTLWSSRFSLLTAAIQAKGRCEGSDPQSEAQREIPLTDDDDPLRASPCLLLFGSLDHSHPKRERIKRVEDFTPVVLVSLSLFYHLPSHPSSSHLSSSLPCQLPPRLPKGLPLFTPTNPLLRAAQCRTQKRKRPAPPKETALKKFSPPRRRYQERGSTRISDMMKKSQPVCISCYHHVFRTSAHHIPSLTEINVDMSKVILGPATRLGSNNADRFLPPRRLSSRLRTFTTRRRSTWRPS